MNATHLDACFLFKQNSPGVQGISANDEVFNALGVYGHTILASGVASWNPGGLPRICVQNPFAGPAAVVFYGNDDAHPWEVRALTRWLILGAGGMLGLDLLAALKAQAAPLRALDATRPIEGDAVVGLTHQDLDITDEAAVQAAVSRHRPKTVVNCAAWTAVDDAEQHEERALEANGRGPEHIAAACADTGARLVHVSTDYVFGGDGRRPYQEHDQPVPRTAYGRTKRAGEDAVLRLLPGSGFVIRTAWLYGAHGRNFVRTMIRLASERQVVEVVADQHGQPTWTADVAAKIIELAGSPAPAGVYHATSSGETTWFGLAREIFRLLGADPARVRPVASSEYRRPAARPSYSVLGHRAWAAAGIEPIGNWQRALSIAFSEVAAAEWTSAASAAPGRAPAAPPR